MAVTRDDFARVLSLGDSISGDPDCFAALIEILVAESTADIVALFPRAPMLRERVLAAVSDEDAAGLEESALELYAYLHMHEAPYTPEERATVDETGGYWAHAGGVSPLIEASRALKSDWVSADLGAGNGLQGLLMQRLRPHARTVQIEISARMVEIGAVLQGWLEVPADRVEWRVQDLATADLEGFDLVYLYRPLRPEGETGRRFYTRLASALEAHPRAPVVLSVADALGPFLSPKFTCIQDDGHLRCWTRLPG